MIQGMSENKSWSERLADNRTKDAREIDDWMHGSGAKVFAVILIALAAWAIVSVFWK